MLTETSVLCDQLKTLSKRIGKPTDVTLVCLRDQAACVIVIGRSVVFFLRRVESRKTKRNANPLAGVFEIACQVLESPHEIDNGFPFVHHKRLLQLKTPVATPANVLGEVLQCRDFNMVFV